MKKICVIPARMGSSRFPGKPLKKALNIPLIVHVAKRCALLDTLDYVVVATCDKEIEAVCMSNNILVVMTSKSHERCTDRVSEAVEKLNLNLKNEDFILMVQGDEILVTPEMLQIIIKDYEKNQVPVINLLSRIYNSNDHADPNVVKVVLSPDNRALYFSRAPIPCTILNKNAPLYQQTGVIGFSRDFLKKFSELEQTPLEKIESIDMLRVIENGIPLKVSITQQETVAVDVIDDLKRAEKILLTDIFVQQYA